MAFFGRPNENSLYSAFLEAYGDAEGNPRGPAPNMPRPDEGRPHPGPSHSHGMPIRGGPPGPPSPPGADGHPHPPPGPHHGPGPHGPHHHPGPHGPPHRRCGGPPGGPHDPFEPGQGWSPFGFRGHPWARGPGGRCGRRGMRRPGPGDKPEDIVNSIPACVMPFLKPYADAISRHGGAPNEFTPAIDVFSQEKAYTVHVLLPGAKKQDIGTEWNAETSSLRVSGVVHRPGDEELLKSLAHDESRVGFFSRIVTLGNKEKVRVLEDEITAKLEAGILRITVPKDLSEKKKVTKKVNIEGNSPVTTDNEKEKNDDLMDVDAAEKEKDNRVMVHPAETETSSVDKGKGKEAEAAAEANAQAEVADPEEQLPQYEEKENTHQASVQDSDGSEDDWEDVKRVTVD